MYSRSHLKYILIILLVPVFLVSLIAADRENTVTNEEIEITSLNLNQVQNRSINAVGTENKIKIKSGDTIYSILIDLGVTAKLINRIASDKNAENFIQLKVNEEIYVTQNKEFLLLEKYDDEFYNLSLTINGDSFDYAKSRDDLKRLKQFKEFVITDSLYASGKKIDVPDSILGDLIYIFGWDIDYVYDIRNGDKVRILYENIYSKGRLIKTGDILAAEFVNRGEELSVIRFTQRGRKDYYSLDSTNIRKAFLRTPIEFARISSHYNPNRKHPILNTIKAHKGTDYAAKRGTPVKVTGDGVIKTMKYSNSYGNYIDVIHYNKYLTRYAHLESFSKNIKLGAKVQQGDTIGFVGSTGLATGPHLHYEFHIDGKHTDPVKVEPPNAQSINSFNKKYFDKLASERKQLIKKLTAI